MAKRKSTYLTKGKEEKLGLIPKRGTQFDEGNIYICSFVEHWCTYNLSTYEGENKHAMQVDGIWYYPIIRNDLNYRIQDVIKHSKERAKRQGVDHDDFTKEYLISIIPKDLLCPVFKIPFNFERGMGVGRRHPYGISLDRIVPSLGYVEGNVMWISNRANNIKGDATFKEISLVAVYIDRVQK